jgi:S1-C subfamily serine protease
MGSSKFGPDDAGPGAGKLGDDIRRVRSGQRSPSSGQPRERRGDREATNGADEVGAANATKAVKGGSEADKMRGRGAGVGRGPAGSTGRSSAGGAAAGAAAGEALAAAPTTPGGPGGPTTPLTWLERLLPKTVRGMVSLIVAASVGAALSGTILYAYYQYRLNQTEQRVGSFVNGFDQRFKTAEGTIQADQANAQAAIQRSLGPIQSVQAQGAAVANLLKQTQASVWFVHTVDANGQPSVGSAFAVSSGNGKTLMLTSYNTVQAATHQPAPTIYVRKGDTDTPATLSSWQPAKDLALLQVNRDNVKTMNFATGDAPLKVGDRIYAVSGLGASGGSITAGTVADASSNVLQSDAAVGTSFQGGPLINGQGDVVGVASRSYSPLGFTSDGIYFGVPIQAACDQVLSCPGGSPPSAGAKP